MRWKIKMPTMAEYNLLQMLLREGAGRIVYGDERRAKYGKVRMGNLLAQNECRAGFCVAQRGPELICWDNSIFDSRRLVDKIAEYARQPERSIYLTELASTQRRGYVERLTNVGKVNDYGEKVVERKREIDIDYKDKGLSNELTPTQMNAVGYIKRKIAENSYTVEVGVKGLVAMGVEEEKARELLNL